MNIEDAPEPIEEEKWHEYEVALYVVADTEEEAMEKLQPLIDLANKLDPEEDAQVRHHGYHVMEKRSDSKS